MNEENKKQIYMLGGLAVVLGGVLWFAVFKGGPETAAVSNPQAGAAVGGTVAGATVGSVFQEASVDLDALIENIKEVEFNYARQRDSRNPTLALIGDHMAFRMKGVTLASGEEAQDLLYEASRKKLTGIMWDAVNPLAVIDDQVVTVGDDLITEGFENESPIYVKAIEPGQVVLAVAGADLEVVRVLHEN